MPCRTCGSPLADDQRYCLECGDRHGPPRLDWKAMVIPPVTAASAPDAPAPGASPAGLPSPRVAAALVLGVLAFGVAVGDAAGPGADAADAGRRAQAIVLAPSPAVAVPVPAVAAPAPQAPPIDESATPDLGDDPVDDTAPLEDAPTTTDDTPPPVDDDTPAVDDDDTAGDDDGTSTDDVAAAPKLPPVKHVWVVALTGHSYAETFGAGATGGAPYLAGELRDQGTLLPWYHAAGHDPAAGGVALLGGQKDATGPSNDKAETLTGQLTGLGRTWKAYIEGATAGLAPGDNPCSRPPEQAPRNPFLRFAAITGDATCGQSMAELDALTADVADGESAPTFSYILPGPAHDGSTSLADADAWLKATLPTILGSKAYADGGLVVVTFDAGAADDAEAGGGRVGALLLSPFVTPGGTVNAPYDPFALLKSVEGLFGLDPLGYAKDTRLKAFGPKVYAAWDPSASR